MGLIFSILLSLQSKFLEVLSFVLFTPFPGLNFWERKTWRGRGKIGKGRREGGAIISGLGGDALIVLEESLAEEMESVCGELELEEEELAIFG